MRTLPTQEETWAAEAREAGRAEERQRCLDIIDAAYERARGSRHAYWVHRALEDIAGAIGRK